MDFDDIGNLDKTNGCCSNCQGNVFWKTRFLRCVFWKDARMRRMTGWKDDDD